MKNLNTAKEVQTAYAAAVDEFLAAYAAEDWETACNLTFDVCGIYEFTQETAIAIEDAKEHAQIALGYCYNDSLAQAVTELAQELNEWVAALEWAEDYRADEYRAAIDEL